ncbi:MAG: hypothetical protein R2810_09230 [Flavobacteriales bacterium]
MKFKKGITNAIVVNGKFTCAAASELYNMDLATGAEKYVVPVAKGGVGQASTTMPYKDMVVVVGDKGVSTFSTETGEPVASNGHKKSEVEDRMATSC